jgi:dGTPase
LASRVAHWLAGQAHIRAEIVPRIPSIAATCGLIHDLGNPPFGHAGELAIQTWFIERLKKDKTFLDDLGADSQRREDFLKFEGNAQTLRLVSHLQLLADFHGLNLTYGTLSAACKYLSPSHDADRQRSHVHRKPGYFASEEEVIKDIREKTDTGSARNPITFLVEAADDIVYSTVDLEDGVKKGVLEWSVVEKLLNNTIFGKEALQRAHNQVDPAGLVGKPESEALVQAFRTHAITLMVNAVFDVFCKRYILIMNGNYEKELITDEESGAKDLIEHSKAILKERVYTSPQILKLEVKGRQVIHALMDLYWEAAEGYTPGGEFKTDTYHSKIYLLLSENYRRVFQKRLATGIEPTKYCRLQLVTDQIAGMTDAYAYRLYSELI